MSGRGLYAELAAARAAMTAEHFAELREYGIAEDIAWPIIGIARIRRDRSGRIYEPCPDGKLAYICAVRVGSHVTPECLKPRSTALFTGMLADLLAFHPQCPDAWALRHYSATWLGGCWPQRMGPPAVHVRRNPTEWLRSRCDGICIVTDDTAAAYLALTALENIVTDDRQHAAALRRIIERPWRGPGVSYAT